MAGLDSLTLGLVAAGLLVAGLCKGMSGFGLPLIGLPLLASVLPIRDALPILCLPMLLANLWQAVEGHQMKVVFARFWPVLVMLSGGAWVGTMVLVALDEASLLATVGSIVILFASVSLARPQFHIPPRYERLGGVILGGAAGLLMGLALHMGPLVVIYFVALRLPKDFFIRAIGLTFLAGSILIWALYLAYGVFEMRHVALSAAAAVPVVIGIWLGQRLRARIDDARFRTGVFLFLIVVGANFLRRALL